MDNQVSSFTSIEKPLPFVDELVDALYTPELNNLINSDNVQVDKRTFLMFIIMFFSARLYSYKDVQKHELKMFITDIIKDSNKRLCYINMFLEMEKSVQKFIKN